MNAKSVADHSRHVVQRLQSSVIHTLLFSFWAPSDLHVLLNEDNDVVLSYSNDRFSTVYNNRSRRILCSPATGRLHYTLHSVSTSNQHRFRFQQCYNDVTVNWVLLLCYWHSVQ